MTNPDVSLGEIPSDPAGHPAHTPTAIAEVTITSLAEAAVKPLSVSEILEHGRRIERTARICIRGDLQAEYDRIILELAGLMGPSGEVIDVSLADGDEGPTPAQIKHAELEAVRHEMSGAMRFVRFRGMPSDEWPGWDKAHRPKGEDPDLTEYNTALIAACAIEPKLSVDEVNSLRGALGSPQMVELANKAWQANTTGGVDVPKSLGSWPSRAQG
ncbi:hypothetical protein [Nocardioides sp. InS609-2]|uniref:hypothetical protein n=1 Tax=Nocardioides sp. InS609-2 TaxID=2760705 RepID=UPI0020BFC761|nr:hypothetical protein [Nocardioides sp. InS609-2]